MRRLSLKQLNEEFTNMKHEYVFSLEDQNHRFTSYITCLDLVFTTMLVSPSQGAICLQSQQNTMLFDFVREIEVVSSTEIGVVFDIVCESHHAEEKRYRVWARPRDQ